MEKVGLKLNIQKTKIMASGPTTSWQIDEEIVETVTDFILGGSLLAQRLKRLPAMRETWVRSLGREDPLCWEYPLEKEIATPSSTLD